MAAMTAVKKTSARYPERLSKRDVLVLLKSGRYGADLATGEVYRRNGNRLATYENYRNDGATPRLWCKLYALPKCREIAVAHLVWMAGTRAVVPTGFEIHHVDENPLNNAFDNLVCVHRVDHDKLHGIGGPDADVPF